MPAPLDHELLTAWRAGDTSAGSRLLVRHFRTVHRFVASKLNRGAEDLVQDTFLRCVERQDDFRGQGSFRSYLLSIARNKIIDHLRARHGLKDPEELRTRSLDAVVDSPSRVVAQHEEQRVLLTALRRIPFDLQVALELHYWEEMTTREIAHVLNVPQGTIKTRLARGRERLRAAIAQVAPGDALATATLANLDEWARSLKDLLPESEVP